MIYVVIAEKALQDATMITCTLLIHFAFVIAFIAKTFVDRIGESIDDLGYDLVASPTGAILATKECVRSVIVVSQQCILLTDFIVLPM